MTSRRMRIAVGLVLACVACSCGADDAPELVAAVQDASSDEADLERFSLFGMSLATIGDVDGDAVPDFAVGEPGRDRVWIYSGADRSVVRTIESDEPYSCFGFTLAAPGDVNEDGVPDLLVGASGSDEVSLGSVHAVDGARGLTIYSIRVPEDGLKLNNYNVAPGPALAVVGDVDGDGVADFAIGSAFAGEDDRGRIVLHSGSDGAVLRTWEGERAGAMLGTTLLAPGDLDGDGKPDVVGGTKPSWQDDTGPGEVRSWSGASGELLARYVPREPSRHFGWSLALVRGDAEQRRLLVGDPFHAPAVHVFDARTGEHVDWWPQTGRGAEAAAVLGTVLDVDGDGVEDVAVVAPNFLQDRLWIVRGSDGDELMTLVVPPETDTRYNDSVGLRMDLLGPIEGQMLLVTASTSVNDFGCIVTAFRFSDGAIAFEIFAP